MCDGYSWAQDLEFVSIYVPIGDLKSKDVVYKIAPTSVCFGIKGAPPVINDELLNIIKPDDSLWEIEMVDGKRTAVAKLRKAKDGQWKFLLKKDDEKEEQIMKERAAIYEAQLKANQEARDRAEKEIQQKGKMQGPARSARGDGSWAAEAAGQLGARLVAR